MARGRSRYVISGSGAKHQQIGVKLFPIIGFTRQLLAIIAYYLLLLLLLFCEFFCYYWLLLQHAQAQTLIIAIIAKLLLQSIISASNHLHYSQLFALFAFIGIND